MSVEARINTRYSTVGGDSYLCTNIITSEGLFLAILQDTSNNAYDYRYLDSEGCFVGNGTNSDINAFYNESDSENVEEPFVWFSGNHLLRIQENNNVTYMSFKTKEELMDFIPKQVRHPGTSFCELDINTAHAMTWREV